MGVPAFFRWLSRKYSSIIVQCVEEKAKNIDGHSAPVDATRPNPNDVEFDNLYLDMNGIIHPCCHPEDKPAPKDEDEMMAAIFEYIDRIFNIVRPRRLLYMAIDGVAPRAKMNQQRSRRFRAAKESIEKHESISSKRAELEAMGKEVPPPKPKSSHFDSNCITPGTEFMARLAVCLQYYVHQRMNNNPAWQGIKVILSDANVPGEGEHKIMDYIRRQRSQPDHDPNTHHCLYGADADLIMLGLATHEPQFTILREEFKPNQAQNKPCDLCGQLGHMLKDCTGEAREKAGEFDQFAGSGIAMEKEFIFIRLCVLREYLERELRINGLPFPFELERAIDDWVFMCFFVGNDFLPHLPSLEIREGAIDRLIRLYKQVVPQTQGYLTFNGRVNLSRVQMILTELGKVEDEIFKNRRQKDMEFRRRNKEKRRRTNSYQHPTFTPHGQFAPQALGSTPAPLINPRQEAYQMRTMSSNQNAAASLKESLKANRRSLPASLPKNALSGAEGQSSEPAIVLGQKRKRQDNEDSNSEPEDNVRLWEDGWKERYYMDKFGVPSDDAEFRQSLTEQYTRGLCWVLGYYYQGCPSWNWFYPFHYAPFASDFKNIKDVRNDFNKGSKPFRPLEQLMGVFPETSGNFLPNSWHDLMSDADSPIIDFYPTNFKIDLNGKKYAWQGVALLPFVNEDRLHKALSSVYPDLNDSEKFRNSLGVDRLFVHSCHGLYSTLQAMYEETGTEDSVGMEINPTYSQGMRGVVSCDSEMKEVLKSGCAVQSPLLEFPAIRKTHVICSTYKDPTYPESHVFEAKLLKGAEMPTRVLKPLGYQGNPWRPQIGFSTPSPQQRSYSTPQPAKRMIRHSLSDPRHQRYNDHQFPNTGRRGGDYQGYDQGGSYSSSRGEMYSSQGASHGFRGFGNEGPEANSKYGNVSRSHSDGNYYGTPPGPSTANWRSPRPSYQQQPKQPQYHQQQHHQSPYDQYSSPQYNSRQSYPSHTPRGTATRDPRQQRFLPPRNQQHGNSSTGYGNR